MDKHDVEKEKRLAVGLLTVALLGLSSMTALANAFSYSGELPAWQGHQTLVAGSAEKTNRYTEYAYNTISELGNNNSFAVCWIDNTTSGGRTQATNRISCYIRKTQDMQYIDYYWSGSAELRAHASNYGVQKTWIKGNVNFG